MKLGWKDIDPFVKNPNPKARAVLIYGPDAGLMRERSDSIGKSVCKDLNDPFNVSTFSAETLLDDKARLADEALAMSMMGGARLIRIEGASDKITTIMKDYLASPSQENLVLVEAGELGTKSSLRALFEKSDNAAALPCYLDDDRAVASLAKQILGDAGYKIQPDALNWLSMNIAGDRMRVRNEIDKLITYMGHDEKTIQTQDVLAICGEAGAQSFDDLIYAIGGGKTEVALFTYNKLLAEGVFVITILRTLQNHFRRLHYTKCLIGEGMDTSSAMKKLQPPIFFKNEAGFKSQLSKWSDKRLLLILERLADVEAQMKQTGTPTETLGSHVVLSLSAQA